MKLRSMEEKISYRLFLMGFLVCCSRRRFASLFFTRHSRLRHGPA